MKIDYLSAKLRRICLEAEAARKELGADSARKLRTRLADLRAASRVSELLVGRPHPYAGKGEKRFSLDLAGGARLIFVPTDDPPPRKEDGGLDWDAVERITIVFLGDRHEG